MKRRTATGLAASTLLSAPIHGGFCAGSLYSPATDRQPALRYAVSGAFRTEPGSA